jgi:WD40 repeat protein
MELVLSSELLSLQDYCIDLRNCRSKLTAVTGDSAVWVWDLTSSIQGERIQYEGPVAEAVLVEDNVVAAVLRAGTLQLRDLRSGQVIQSQGVQQELFTIDWALNSIAIGGSKSVAVWDLRTMTLRAEWEDLYAKGNDVTCVRLSPVYPNLLLSCGEDGLMNLCNVESTEEDDYISTQ